MTLRRETSTYVISDDGTNFVIKHLTVISKLRVIDKVTVVDVLISRTLIGILIRHDLNF